MSRKWKQIEEKIINDIYMEARKKVLDITGVFYKFKLFQNSESENEANIDTLIEAA